MIDTPAQLESIRPTGYARLSCSSAPVRKQVALKLATVRLLARAHRVSRPGNLRGREWWRGHAIE